MSWATSGVDPALMGSGPIPASKKALEFTPEKAINSVAASDAFFPFPDGIQELIKVGVSAIIQPGGSIRDSETIAAANEHNMTMIFTHERAFKH